MAQRVEKEQGGLFVGLISMGFLKNKSGPTY
ncbi:uncharacterized protein G2W53_034218 [Senna tora]|uniref:Uncharacterized protein n=1 Tax=Senna tora TaxID=362788 RepID=A0A834T3Q3_9FABA|nr:uncharacterized protein G2W53_034218 [Senna tora]